MKFHHQAPDGFEYWQDQFSETMTRIWIRNLRPFSYTNKQPSSIWGFWDKKRKVFLSPINYKKPGKVVDIEKTTAYSAMQLNLNPLEYALFK